MKPDCSISSANRLRKTDTASGAVDYVLGVGDRLASFTGGAYEYDAAGCVTNISGGASSPSEPLSRALAWNAQYQLLSVSTNGAFAESWTWDALGRRATTTTVEGTVRHVYDGNQCIADLDETGVVVRSYVWGPGIDNLLSVIVADGNGQSRVYYALTDHQNTVHGFLDAAGALVAHYVYDAWGNVLESSVSVPALADNRYLFQGREYSWATGLYNFRARWYDPATGRWLSKDPIGISGGMNLYAFFGNNAICCKDPQGTLFHLIIGAAFGAISGAIDAYARGEKDWKGAIKGAAVGFISSAIGTGVVRMLESTRAISTVGHALAEGATEIFDSAIGSSVGAGVTSVGMQLAHGENPLTHDNLIKTRNAALCGYGAGFVGGCMVSGEMNAFAAGITGVATETFKSSVKPLEKIFDSSPCTSD